MPLPATPPSHIMPLPATPPSHTKPHIGRNMPVLCVLQVAALHVCCSLMMRCFLVPYA
jgi:hypothetical protein